MQENKESSLSSEQKAHTLTIEQQKKLTLTGVESVTSFSPQQINLQLAGGKLAVQGEGLKITSFSKSSGTFSASGTVYSVKYGARGGKFTSLFK
ncbi:MAG: YabP/YqfC family sporulation protein [Clostridia bacterium]|nr:YabP/YqfC family sporulation protein [Clostridia bacterium]